MTDGKAFVYGPAPDMTMGGVFFLVALGSAGIITILLATLSDLGRRSNRFQVMIFLAGLIYGFEVIVGAYVRAPLNPLWPLVELITSATFYKNSEPDNTRAGAWIYIWASFVGYVAGFVFHVLFAWWLPERAGGHPAAHKEAAHQPSHSNLAAPIPHSQAPSAIAMPASGSSAGVKRLVSANENAIDDADAAKLDSPHSTVTMDAEMSNGQRPASETMIV